MNEGYEPPALPDLDLVLGIPRWGFVVGLVGATAVAGLFVWGAFSLGRPLPAPRKRRISRSQR